MQSPYAKLLMSLDGGSNVFGAQTCAGGVTVQLHGENTAFWDDCLYEIYEYPAGFVCPDDWTSVNGVYQSSGTAFVPPAFDLDSSSNWGKYLFRLTVNGGMRNGAFAGVADPQPLVYTASCLRVLSPTFGLHGIGFQEGGQFDAQRLYIGELMQMFKAIDAGGGGGNVFAGAFADRPAASAAPRYTALDGFSYVSDGTNWYNDESGIACTPPPLAAAMTGVNLGGSDSFSDLAGTTSVLVHATSGGQLVGPSINFGGAYAEAQAVVSVAGLYDSGVDGFPAWGIALYDTVSTHAASVVLAYNLTNAGGADNSNAFFSTTAWTSPTNVAGASNFHRAVVAGPIFIRLNYNASPKSVDVYWSRTKVAGSWSLLTTITGAFTSAPNKVVAMSYGNKGGPDFATLATFKHLKTG